MTDASYLEFARELLSAGDFTAAEDALRVLLRTHHSRPDATLMLAELKIRQGAPQEAVALLRPMVTDRDCGDRLRDYFVGERMNEAALDIVSNRPHDQGPSGFVDASLQLQLSGELPSAINTAQRAIALAPDDARALNQIGRALFNARQVPQALAALEQATRAAPDSPEAWHNLGHVLRATQQFERSEQAYAKACELAPAYRSGLLNLGITRLARGNNEAALAPLQQLCELAPDNAEAWYNRGLALHALRRLDEARECYEKAAEIEPGNIASHRQLGSLSNELIDTEGALRHFRNALALSPRDPDLLAEVASLLERANRLGEARETLDYGLQHAPRDPGLNLEAAKLDRRSGKADVGLQRLREIDPARLHPRLHASYWFELGTALDRAGDSSGAYTAFVRGNDLSARSLRARMTDASAFDRHMDAIEEWLAAGAPASPSLPDEDLGEDLCFLLGFPRSGTTLLDVMLDGHALTSAIEERATIEHVAFAVDSRHGGYPFGMTTLDRAARDALRAQYRTLATQEGAHFGPGRVLIDKMPIRTVHAAFIHRLFPRAKFLFALRHPCDSVLSNFMQQFAINEVFLHFTSLPESVRVYDRVMKIWQKTLKVLPLPVHYVRYEALVADTPETLRGVCEFLGLPWQADLADHQKNLEERGRIKTNSYHQVAEPVYRRALDRWRNYRAPFQPYLDTLRPHVEHFGYTLD